MQIKIIARLLIISIFFLYITLISTNRLAYADFMSMTPTSGCTTTNPNITIMDNMHPSALYNEVNIVGTFGGHQVYNQSVLVTGIAPWAIYLDASKAPLMPDGPIQIQIIANYIDANGNLVTPDNTDSFLLTYTQSCGSTSTCPTVCATDDAICDQYYGGVGPGTCNPGACCASSVQVPTPTPTTGTYATCPSGDVCAYAVQTSAYTQVQPPIICGPTSAGVQDLCYAPAINPPTPPTVNISPSTVCATNGSSVSINVTGDSSETSVPFSSSFDGSQVSGAINGPAVTLQIPALSTSLTNFTISTVETIGGQQLLQPSTIKNDCSGQTTPTATPTIATGIPNGEDIIVQVSEDSPPYPENNSGLTKQIADITATDSQGNKYQQSSYTSSNGAYTFTNLPVGNYSVDLQPANDYTFTTVSPHPFCMTVGSTGYSSYPASGPNGCQQLPLDHQTTTFTNSNLIIAVFEVSNVQSPTTPTLSPTVTPTTTPSPTTTGGDTLTLSPSHGCLNTSITAKVNGVTLTSGDLATGFFNNNGISSITSGAQVLGGFVPWSGNSITIIPNQKMSYLGEGTSTDLNQSSNFLDYNQLLGPGPYPITFNFNGNSDVPANTNAVGTYTVDASCFPAATGTPTPSSTPSPTPTLIPNIPIFTFKVHLNGIGDSGDVINSASSLSNKHPIDILTGDPIETIPFMVSATSDTGTFETTGGFIFDGNKFTGQVQFSPTLANGTYTFAVSADKYIRELSPENVIIDGTSTNYTIPDLSLIVGDVTDDGQMDVDDYTELISCMTEQSSCNDTARQMSDLNDDGVIDEKDYNLFVREYSGFNSDANIQDPIEVTPIPGS